jgi:hypothetical protein
MPTYHVTWEIDGIDADSPEDAARQCREMLLDPANTARVFQVEDVDGGNAVEIDTDPSVAAAATLSPAALVDAAAEAAALNDDDELNADERKVVELIDDNGTLTSFAGGCGSDDLEERITDEVDRNDLDIDVSVVDWVKVLDRFQNT